MTPSFLSTLPSPTTCKNANPIITYLVQYPSSRPRCPNNIESAYQQVSSNQAIQTTGSVIRDHMPTCAQLGTISNTAKPATHTLTPISLAPSFVAVMTETSLVRQKRPSERQPFLDPVGHVNHLLGSDAVDDCGCGA